MYTKDSLPVDIDFLIQDTFALLRPQWTLVADLGEAGRAFADLVKQNYKSQEPEKVMEAEELDDSVSSDEEAEDDEPPVPDMEDAHSSSDEAEIEAEAEVCNSQPVLLWLHRLTK